MKTVCFILAAACLAAPPARADINTDNLGPAPAPAASATPTPLAAPANPGAASSSSATDPAEIADFERRFAQGRQLEQQGKLADARAIFDGILAEAPDAKGSLREAGIVSMKLNDYARADGYLSRLHALVPDYPMAIEALIQVNQTLKHDAKVEILIAQFEKLYAAGKVPPPAAAGDEIYFLRDQSQFVRERIRLDSGTEIVITQFFDYHQPRYYAWAAQLFDAAGRLTRCLTVGYDPDVTQTLRAKNPALAHAEQFLLADDVLSNGRVTRIDVYQQFLALPDYLKMRTVMLEVFAHALKPIDSAPIPQNPS